MKAMFWKHGRKGKRERIYFTREESFQKKFKMC